MTVLALTIPAANTIGWVSIGVLVLIALLVLFVVKKIVGKVISVVLILAVAGAIYVQRDNLTNCANSCKCTFFGIHLEIPNQSLSDACKNAVNSN